MAKKKSGGPNKSEAIRDYYAANPTAKPKEVAEALSKQGISVTPAFVSTIRSTSKTKKKTGKRGRPAGRKTARKTARKTGRRVGRPATARRGTAARGDVSLDSLVRVKEIVDEMGGVEDARSALAALERLQD